MYGCVRSRQYTNRCTYLYTNMCKWTFIKSYIHLQKNASKEQLTILGRQVHFLRCPCRRRAQQQTKKNKTAPSLARCKRQTGQPRLQTRAVQAPMQISGRERTGRCVRVSGQPHASPPWSFLGIPTLSQTRCSLARRERRAVYDRAQRQTSAHYAPRERP